MGFLRRPSYYKDFQCISSACTDSCCQQWEIDIDEETLEFYKSVGGSFGKRLMEHIELPEDEDAPAHFIQAEKERCPFLNAEGLCDIFTELGEEHLSWICTHHPRYYDWFQKGREAGLGLCCEEAARLMLTAAQGPDFEVLELAEDAEDSELAGDSEPADDDSEDGFDELLENELFAMREELFSLIRGMEPSEHDEKLDLLYGLEVRITDRYDDIMFGAPEEDEIDPDFGVSCPDTTFTEAFWKEEQLLSLIDFYAGLEINDPAWWELLEAVKKNIGCVLEARKAFHDFYAENMRQYDNLLIYFLFRYFLKGREDGMPAQKLQFALISTAMIELLGVHTWLTTGSLTLRQQIDLVKLYSKEIEYDEENMLAVSEVVL